LAQRFQVLEEFGKIKIPAREWIKKPGTISSRLIKGSSGIL
jgi:hypothetical protein